MSDPTDDSALFWNEQHRRGELKARNDRMLYRPRGVNPYTGNDVFITNCWFVDLEQAQQVVRNYSREHTGWKKVRLVSMKERDYHKKYQNIPKLC